MAERVAAFRHTADGNILFLSAVLHAGGRAGYATALHARLPGVRDRERRRGTAALPGYIHVPQHQAPEGHDRNLDSADCVLLRDRGVHLFRVEHTRIALRVAGEHLPAAGRTDFRPAGLPRHHQRRETAQSRRPSALIQAK